MLTEAKPLSDELFNCESLDEVTEKFSLAELLELTKLGELQSWLNKNFYEQEARNLHAAREGGATDARLKLEICHALKIGMDTLGDDEAEELSDVVKKIQRNEIFGAGHADDRKVAFVETQRELVNAVADGAQVIYLIGGEFRISLEHGATYIGRENALIDFPHDGDVDLDARGIVLEDVQLYLHHPIAVKAVASKNLRLLNGARKTLKDRLTLQEIFAVMRGRSPFESAENFSRRAQDVNGVAVGTVLFTDDDYDYDAQTFTIRPQWNVDFIAVLGDFVREKIFFVELTPENAELLYQSERKQQIFADYVYRDGALTILKLYLETMLLGRVFIVDRRIVREKFLATSGEGGYGLNLITYVSETEQAELRTLDIAGGLTT